MKIKRIILLFLIFLLVSSYTFAKSSYIWSGSSSALLEAVSDTETDLKLESGGAILIEQTTRLCIIRS